MSSVCSLGFGYFQVLFDLCGDPLARYCWGCSCHECLCHMISSEMVEYIVHSNLYELVIHFLLLALDLIDGLNVLGRG